MKTNLKRWMVLLLAVLLLPWNMVVSVYAQDGVRDMTYIAVYIDFPDEDMQTPEMQVNKLDTEAMVKNAYMYLNGGEDEKYMPFSEEQNVVSLKTYVKRESYGKINLEAKIFPVVDGKVKSHMSIHNRRYYMPYNETNPEGYTSDEKVEREQELLREAFMDIKEQIENDPDITSENLDSDSDGNIDAISFFVEAKNSNNEVHWLDVLWSHKDSYRGEELSIYGKKVNDYNIVSAKAPSAAGVNGMFSYIHPDYSVIIHEFMHTLGLPDLYSYGGQQCSTIVGAYDIMSYNIETDPQPLSSIMSADLLRKEKETDIPVISVTTENFTLYKPEYQDTDEQRCVIVRSPYSNEYFVIDYYDQFRTSQSMNGSSTGLVIYRVYGVLETFGNANGPDQAYMYLMRPGDTYPNEANNYFDGVSQWSLNNAPINAQNPTYGKTLEEGSNGFDNTTIYFSDGSNSGIRVDYVSSTEDSITFDITTSNIQGNGTENNPYLIYTEDDFMRSVMAGSFKYFKLMSDLDFSDQKYEQSKTWLKASFDGNGHTISHLSVPLFRSMENAVIKNLTIEAADISIPEFDGGILAISSAGTSFENITIKSSKISGPEIGGIVGLSSGDTFSDCYVDAVIENAQTSGGLCYIIGGNVGISDCIVTSTLSGENRGAFIGTVSEYVESNISFNNCFYDSKKIGDASSLTDRTYDGIKGCTLLDLSLTDENPTYTMSDYEGLDYDVIVDTDCAVYDAQNQIIVGQKPGNGTYRLLLNAGTHQLELSAALASQVTEIEDYPVTFDYGEDSEGIEIIGENIAHTHQAYTATVITDEAHAMVLPQDIVITVGGSPLVSGEGYTYDPETGVLTILGEYVNGEIKIFVHAERNIYPVTMQCENGSFVDAKLSVVHGNAYSVILKPDTGYDLPSEITVSVDGQQLLPESYVYDQQSGKITLDQTVVTGAIDIQAACTRKVFAAELHMTDIDAPLIESVTYGSEVSMVLTAKEGYTLPVQIQISVDGSLLDPSLYEYHQESGEVRIPADLVTGTLVIYAKGEPNLVSVTKNAVNASYKEDEESSSQQAYYGIAYKTTVEADTGYRLPEDITVTVDGERLDPSQYTYSMGTGEILILAEAVTGDISINVEAIKRQFSVMAEAIHGSFSSQNDIVDYGQDYGVTLIPDSGYQLPENVTITVGGRQLSPNEYGYDQTNGDISIGGQSVNGNIVIWAECEEPPKTKETESESTKESQKTTSGTAAKTTSTTGSTTTSSTASKNTSQSTSQSVNTGDTVNPMAVRGIVVLSFAMIIGIVFVKRHTKRGE